MNFEIYVFLNFEIYEYTMEQKARRLGASEFGLSDRKDN